MWKKLSLQVKIIYWYIIIFAKMNEVQLTACNVSISTLQKVSKCPSTEIELSETRGRKDCRSLAKIQKCSTPQNFTYHCVINAWQNETYEVCAPAIFSQGRCLEFNQYGKVIQELDINCVEKGCPKRFRSADTLKYAVCSRLVKQQGFNSKPCLNNDWNAISISLAVISGVFILLLPFVVFLFFQKRVIGYWKGTQPKEPEEMKKLTSEERGKTKDLTKEELIDAAIKKLSEEYESKKKRKNKNRNPTTASRFENFTEDSNTLEPISENSKYMSISSAKSIESNVSIKPGFDSNVFKYFLKKYSLLDCEDILFEKKIDCLHTFFELDEDNFKSFGLQHGQVRKCLGAKQEALAAK